jgi:hypothetical protein
MSMSAYRMPYQPSWWGEMLTGLSLARYVLPGALRLLPASAARTWHSSLAYQGLVLVGVHAAMHLGRLLVGPGNRWRAIRAAKVAWACMGVALVPPGCRVAPAAQLWDPPRARRHDDLF